MTVILASLDFDFGFYVVERLVLEDERFFYLGCFLKGKLLFSLRKVLNFPLV